MSRTATNGRQDRGNYNGKSVQPDRQAFEEAAFLRFAIISQTVTFADYETAYCRR